MFREFVRDRRDRKAVVKIHLANGGCVQGRIDQIGPEAIILLNAKGVQQLVMKPAIVSISPGDAVRKEG